MFDVLKARLRQKYRTMAYPKGPPPALPARFAGRPVLAAGEVGDFAGAMDGCPTGALHQSDGQVQLDMGKCLFCCACQGACSRDVAANTAATAPSLGVINFSGDHQLAAARREDLIIKTGAAACGTAAPGRVSAQ